MEKNCFHVESIKGVNDGNLPVLNCLSFVTDGLGDFELGIIAPKGSIISWTGGSPLLIGGSASQTSTNSPYTVTRSSTTVVKGSVATKITINNKYLLTRLNIKTEHISISLNDIYPCASLENLEGSNTINGALTGLDLTKFLSNNFVTIINVPIVNGTLSALARNTNLEQLWRDALYEGNLTGDISEIANLKKLTKLDVRRTQVTGSLNTFVEGQMQGADGRSDGNLQMKFGDTTVTLNDVILNETVKLIYSADTCVVNDFDNNLLATYTKSTGTWTYPS